MVKKRPFATTALRRLMHQGQAANPTFAASAADTGADDTPRTVGIYIFENGASPVTEGLDGRDSQSTPGSASERGCEPQCVKSLTCSASLAALRP